MVSRDTQIRILLHIIELLERHPRAVKLLLRPLATAPLISKRLMVMPRAYMGATALEIHDIDNEQGRIGIGGVEEVLIGSKIIHLFHTVLAERLGEKQKNEVVYELAYKLCRWEVEQSLEHGRWVPRAMVPLIQTGRIFDEIQSNPLVARFFNKTMATMSRLIIDEGGWGRIEYELDADPPRVHYTHSQEARWLGPAEKPVCFYYAGIVAGYASTISGEEVDVVEVACAAAGAPRCTFEIRRRSVQ